MNKKLFVVALVFLWAAVQADSFVGSLKIYSDPVYATPFPVEPGSYFEVWIKVQNTGTTVNSAECEVMPKHPFLLDGEASSKPLGQIVQNNYAYVKYNLRVASDAAQGNADLNVRCKTNVDPLWASTTVSIPIQTAQPTLNIDSVSFDPTEVRPGSEAKITVTVKNYAPNTLKDILVKMDTSAATPLAPVGGSSEKRVASLAPGASAQIIFDAIVLPDAAPRVYKVPLALQYGDELGKTYSKDDVLTVIVSDAPRILIGLESTDIIRSGTQGKVSIKIINQGLSEAKFMRVIVQKGNGFEIVSPAENYLGTLSSDDYETAEVTLFIKPGTKTLEVPVRVEFTDALNKERVQTASVPVRLYSEDEISSMGLEQKAGIDILLIIVVLAAVVYAAYKLYPRFKKK